MNNIFPCNQCGACCQSVGNAKETASLNRGDGTCKHYIEETKLCSIYDSRPDICSVEKQYQINYKKKYSWDDFVQLNLIACKELSD